MDLCFVLFVLFLMSYTSHQTLLIVGHPGTFHLFVIPIHCEGVLTPPD